MSVVQASGYTSADNWVEHPQGRIFARSWFFTNNQDDVDEVAPIADEYGSTAHPEMIGALSSGQARVVRKT